MQAAPFSTWPFSCCHFYRPPGAGRLSAGPGQSSREQPGLAQGCLLLVMLLVPKGDSFSSHLPAGEEWPHGLLGPHQRNFTSQLLTAPLPEKMRTFPSIVFTDHPFSPSPATRGGQQCGDQVAHTTWFLSGWGWVGAQAMHSLVWQPALLHDL